jgi:hypothetical protein
MSVSVNFHFIIAHALPQARLHSWQLFVHQLIFNVIPLELEQQVKNIIKDRSTKEMGKRRRVEKSGSPILCIRICGKQQRNPSSLSEDSIDLNEAGVTRPVSVC